MGIWGYVCSTSESLKRNTPDLTAVKGWGSSSYGGTLVYKAVLRSIRGEKKFDQGHELDMKALQAEVAELKETLKSAGLVRAEKHQPCADLKSTVYKKPEDVIRVFMMKEFMGMRLLDDRSDGS
ncbi:uncharacterized protein LOC133875751 isoform X3 [Alnus glutinosa]|uniref:uncharacterized protein LOC133875751 isoform X3 n=1 Tax=Alnus glutinosa TaxID=3517 RepID=UPI002D78BAE1|nr:uncharacterized protein LOC133875751 isoform X3 [Alnus glutinosa]